MPKPPEYITLYGIRNHYSGRFLNNLTNPKRKFWEKKGMAERAMMNYDPAYHVPGHGRAENPDTMELCELHCEIRPIMRRKVKEKMLREAVDKKEIL